jgi:N-acetyl-gamma-glutamyl-phosphate reductase
MNSSFSAGIIGASGYTGAELLRILEGHPQIKVVVATGNSDSGKSIDEIFPHLTAFKGINLTNLKDQKGELDKCDIVFSCLPHGEGMDVLPTIKTRVIDLASDFRLRDPSLYIQWYGKPHSNQESLASWVYGLPECFRSSISNRETRQIANPGCYATGVIVSLAPAVAHGLIDGAITVDACSGTSGAGKKMSFSTHFSHLGEGMNAYKVGCHQHTGEIEQALNEIASIGNYKPVVVSMTAHLIPVARGIHATCSASLSKAINTEELRELYREWYIDEPFITISSNPPHTKIVRGTNRIVVSPTVDNRTNRLIVTSVLDNLVKGAAGQAIQNANILLEIPETMGLTASAIYP